MISRFRIEAEGSDKQKVHDQLLAAVSTTISTIKSNDEIHQPSGEWECTDDAITGNGKHYHARMVLRFRLRSSEQ